MSDRTKEVFFVVGGVVAILAGCALFMFLVFAGVQVVSLRIEPNIVVTVDEKEVYNGSAACVDVKSSGATTRVDISGGFLCMFPKEYFVSDKVTVRNRG